MFSSLPGDSNSILRANYALHLDLLANLIQIFPASVYKLYRNIRMMGGGGGTHQLRVTTSNKNKKLYSFHERMFMFLLSYYFHNFKTYFLLRFFVFFPFWTCSGFCWANIFTISKLISFSGFFAFFSFMTMLGKRARGSAKMV